MQTVLYIDIKMKYILEMRLVMNFNHSVVYLSTNSILRLIAASLNISYRSYDGDELFGRTARK